MEKDYTSIELKATEIHDALKTDENSGYFNGLLILIVMITLGAIVFHYIMFEFTPILILAVVALFFYLILYRIKMKSKYKLCKALGDYGTQKEIDTPQYLNAYFNYLESGVEIKQTRSKYIKNLYIIIFPFFLVLLRELFVGQYSGAGIFWGFILALFVSYLIWSFFFRDDLDEWEIMEDELAQYKSKVFL